MIWRRIARMLGFRHAAELHDERSMRAEQLAALEHAAESQTTAVKAMKEQAKTGRYSRIRVDALAAQKRVGR